METHYFNCERLFASSGNIISASGNILINLKERISPEVETFKPIVERHIVHELNPKKVGIWLRRVDKI